MMHGRKTVFEQFCTSSRISIWLAAFIARVQSHGWLLALQVYRGRKQGVQPVAIKMLQKVDSWQLSQFAKVTTKLFTVNKI